MLLVFKCLFMSNIFYPEQTKSFEISKKSRDSQTKEKRSEWGGDGSSKSLSRACTVHDIFYRKSYVIVVDRLRARAVCMGSAERRLAVAHSTAVSLHRRQSHDIPVPPRRQRRRCDWRADAGRRGQRPLPRRLYDCLRLAVDAVSRRTTPVARRRRRRQL